ncbi:MAG: nucleotide sugar dehydrogenase [Candidatus Melainabacteria bacterium]|nr:MAG: nucleotide sugar dehydrogenase [Candidatus Melainabacteria bacterium]
MSNKTKVTIIGGCGHVGLPLGIILADSPNFEVTQLDIDDKKIAQVNAGEMPFMEEGMEPILRKVASRTLRATSDMGCLESADVVISVIGTPVDRHLNPLLKEIHRHADQTIERMKDDALLIMRSTLYPGVTKLIYDRIKMRKRNIHLAVCPERILQGKALYEVPELPQIVGAFEKEAERRAGEFFKRITKTVIYVHPLEAEFGKLMVNSWRYLDFANANQFYILCQRYGLDFYRIFEAFRYEYPRMKTWPKAGFSAGPCLLKDTLQLCAFSNNLFSLGSQALVVNESLPNFIIERLQPANLAGHTVAILGMAFKGNCDDKRDSLAYKLKNLLKVYAKEVYCTDPHVPDADLVPLEKALEAEVIILGAPHAVYADLQFPKEKIVVDVFGFWPRTEVRFDKAVPIGNLVQISD